MKPIKNGAPCHALTSKDSVAIVTPAESGRSMYSFKIVHVEPLSALMPMAEWSLVSIFDVAYANDSVVTTGSEYETST